MPCHSGESYLSDAPIVSCCEFALGIVKHSYLRMWKTKCHGHIVYYVSHETCPFPPTSGRSIFSMPGTEATGGPFKQMTAVDGQVANGSAIIA